MSKFKKNGSKGMPAISTASLPDIVFMLLFLSGNLSLEFCCSERTYRLCSCVCRRARRQVRCYRKRCSPPAFESRRPASAELCGKGRSCVRLGWRPANFQRSSSLGAPARLLCAPTAYIANYLGFYNRGYCYDCCTVAPGRHFPARAVCVEQKGNRFPQLQP